MALTMVNVNLPLMDETCLYTVQSVGGRWTRIEPQSEVIQSGLNLPLAETPISTVQDGATLDAQGRLMLPGLIDAHMHLDKAFSLAQVGNQSGTLQEAIRNYANAVHGFSKDELKARIRQAAECAVTYGTAHIRTHLDFHVEAGREVAMRTLEAALEVRETLASKVQIQLCPMIPPRPLTIPQQDMIREAVRMGIDGIGGAPHLVDQPDEFIRQIFDFAESGGLFVDIHTDESDDPSKRTVQTIAAITTARGYQGKVTVDHLCSLASMPDDEALPLLDAIAKSELFAVTLPAANLYLQGRHDHFPVRRGVTRVKEMLQRGIPIATASDNICDPFHPFGRGDLLLIGLITAYAAHMGSAAEMRSILRMITEIPARILGITDYGMAPGHPADFVLFDARTPESLFSRLPEKRWVFRGDSFLSA